jgi:hypothetical protein
VCVGSAVSENGKDAAQKTPRLHGANVAFVEQRRGRNDQISLLFWLVGDLFGGEVANLQLVFLGLCFSLAVCRVIALFTLSPYRITSFPIDKVDGPQNTTCFFRFGFCSKHSRYSGTIVLVYVPRSEEKSTLHRTLMNVLSIYFNFKLTFRYDMFHPMQVTLAS